MYRVIGHGSYGIIAVKDNNICFKISTRTAFTALIRECIILKILQKIDGITEFISLEEPTYEHVLTVAGSKYNFSTPLGIIKMKRYKYTLREWLTKHSSMTERRRIMKDLIIIMNQVHNNNIIHSDLKLENIMITEEGVVKIIDWGLSGPKGKALVSLTSNISRPNIITNDLSHDIYGLGILFTELLLGIDITINHTKIKKIINHSNLTEREKYVLIHMLKENPEDRITLKEILEPISLNIQHVICPTLTELSDKFISLYKNKDYIARLLENVIKGKDIVKYITYEIYHDLQLFFEIT